MKKLTPLGTMIAIAVFFHIAVTGPAWSQAVPKEDNWAAAGKLSEVLEGAHRSEQAKARDVYRHPLATLHFFGLEPDMTVVEVTPGGGWYTDVLAPFLKDQGQLYLAGGDPNSFIPFYRNMTAKLLDRVQADPATYGTPSFTVMAYPKRMELAPEGSVDMVLTFRNVHSWMGDDFAPEALQAMYRALKPGGILGLVEHRGALDIVQDPKAGIGYVREDYVIQLATEAGFELVEISQINANPKDTKDYPEGVWTLPPTLQLKSRDREKYLAIGESDRMTLKFQKPGSATDQNP